MGSMVEERNLGKVFAPSETLNWVMVAMKFSQRTIIFKYGAVSSAFWITKLPLSLFFYNLQSSLDVVVVSGSLWLA